MQLIVRLTSLIASYASLYGLYFTVVPVSETRSAWHTVVLTFSVLVCLFTVGIELISYYRSKPHSYTKEADIAAYMQRWIASGGRTVVFSRDLSWAEGNKEIERLLEKKATRRELIIILEKETNLTSFLKELGAAIYYYGGFDFVPLSRFTIVDYEKLDARVAIGARTKGFHNITEHASEKSVEFYLANDIVRLVINRTNHNV